MLSNSRMGALALATALMAPIVARGADFTPALQKVIADSSKSPNLSLSWGQSTMGGSRSAALFEAGMNKMFGANVKIRFTPGPSMPAIGNEIVSRQEEFFRRGAVALKPLIMAQIADAVGLHVTTIRRAVSGKYMETPQGLLEMRYFFTPGFQSGDGGSVSNEMVKDAIREMVDQESPRSPLSDQDIVGRLDDQGIKVARRTIAKYREQLSILPSHLRKSC